MNFLAFLQGYESYVKNLKWVNVIKTLDVNFCVYLVRNHESGKFKPILRIYNSKFLNDRNIEAKKAKRLLTKLMKRNRKQKVLNNI